MAFTATFTLTLSDFPPNGASVSYTTIDGTAIAANGDYTATRGTLTFLSTEKVKTIAVSVASKKIASQDKAFTLSFSNFSGMTINGQSQIQPTSVTSPYSTTPEIDRTINFAFPINLNGITGNIN